MTPASITQWLQEPNRDLNTEELQSLQESYPYFTPLHYMAAAMQQVKGEPVKLTGYPDLYVGNRLLFHELMKQAATITVVTELIPTPPIPEIVDEPAILEEAISTETLIIPLVPEIIPETEPSMKEEPLIQPVFSEDYFLHQGIAVDDAIPQELDAALPVDDVPEVVAAPDKKDPKSLMVVMSFTEWLMHFRSKTQKEKEEEEDRKAVKHMWQREKLAAALEEEDDEIPENVFEMAVNSITKEDGLASESLAEIMVKQGKWDKAIEMYRKLSLRNPQKSAYFAQQIALIQKKSDS